MLVDLSLWVFLNVEHPSIPQWLLLPNRLYVLGGDSKIRKKRMDNLADKEFPVDKLYLVDEFSLEFEALSALLYNRASSTGRQ